jgi:hypothetical protein
MGGDRMAHHVGATIGAPNGTSDEADGTIGIAELCPSLRRYRPISDTIPATVILRERGRSRYIARTIDISPATLKSGSMDQHTHSNEIMDLGGAVSPKCRSNAARGRAMTILPSSLHPGRALLVAEILINHSGQGKMGAAPILPRHHRNSGSGMVR